MDEVDIRETLYDLDEVLDALGCTGLARLQALTPPACRSTPTTALWWSPIPRRSLSTTGTVPGTSLTPSTRRHSLCLPGSWRHRTRLTNLVASSPANKEVPDDPA